MEFSHYPVLYKEILNLIIKFQPKNILDCTFGLGGHTQLILQNTNANVTAIDCDINTVHWVEKLQNTYPNRLTFINKKFSQAIEDLKQNHLKFDWIIGDFGVSSMQLDDPTRGFSFRHNSPLKMDMDHNSNDRCYWLVNESNINILANVIKKYGQERNYYNIAKHIINNRPINTTYDLKKIIEEKIYDKNFINKTLARVFQAIRIYTNNELEEINILLNNIESIGHKDTKFCWIYFHSLEGDCVHNWYKKYKKLYKKSMEIIKPSKKELEENNRSRSAIMMIVI